MAEYEHKQNKTISLSKYTLNMQFSPLLPHDHVHEEIKRVIFHVNSWHYNTVKQSQYRPRQTLLLLLFAGPAGTPPIALQPSRPFVL
jgi:hypothetical protein